MRISYSFARTSFVSTGIEGDFSLLRGEFSGEERKHAHCQIRHVWYVMRILCPLQTRSLALQSPCTGIEFQSLFLCFPYLPSFTGLTQPRCVVKKGSNGYCPLYLLNCKFHLGRSCSPSLALSTEPGTWNICGLTE